MAAKPLGPVQLTAEEQSLRDEIRFDPRAGHDALVRSCSAAKLLMLSLLKRNALPAIRREYFTSPEYNVGSKVAHAGI